MTENLTKKMAQYLQPGDRLAARDATGTIKVHGIVPDRAHGTVTVRTDRGSWTVDLERIVSVVEREEDEDDPFAGVPVQTSLPTTPQGPPATDKQMKFLRTLVQDKDINQLNGAQYERAFDIATDSGKLITKDEASDLIGALLKLSDREGATPDVPAGRYAVDAVDGSHVVFYQVDRPEEGRWAGRTFVKQLIGAPGDWRKERQSRAVSKSVLERIAEAGPREAAIRFGHESGVCGRCGSPLSDPDSLARGIGPICADKAGW